VKPSPDARNRLASAAEPRKRPRFLTRTTGLMPESSEGLAGFHSHAFLLVFGGNPFEDRPTGRVAEFPEGGHRLPPDGRGWISGRPFERRACGWVAELPEGGDGSVPDLGRSLHDRRQNRFK
jgi:hypothetical protein